MNAELPLRLRSRIFLAVLYSSPRKPSRMRKTRKANYDSSSVIKLLHYAREIAPTNRSEIDSISIIENRENSVHPEVIITKQTRQDLKDKANRLNPNIEFFEGIGVVREMDLDKHTFRFILEKDESDISKDLDCHASSGSFSDDDLSGILNKTVRIIGFLTKKLASSLVEVDKIEHLIIE